MSAPRVVVVGGGLAGLSAAIACADGGARVTLLEARPRLGGATFSFSRQGMSVDNGQHVFLRCCTAYRWFLSRVGSASGTALQPRLAIPVLAPGGTTGWLRRARFPAPLHLAGALARYPHLEPAERVGVARTALALSRLRPGPDLDERTFGAWLREHGASPAATAALWDLIALPTLNLPAGEASLALAAKVFQTGLLEDPAAGDVGYATAPLSAVNADPARDALAAGGAEIRTRATVRGVEPQPSGGLDVLVDGGRLAADAVVVAVPHEAVGDLVPAAALPRGQPAALGTSPIVNVHVVYDRRVMEHAFVAGVGTPVQWAFDRTAPSGLGAGQYVAVSVSGARAEIAERTEDLRARFVAALADLFPAARSARVQDVFVTREHAATFRQSPGTARLRPGPVTPVPGLYLAGAWTDTGWPATMEGAVRSGLAAARHALLRLGRTRRLPVEEAA